MFIRWFFFISVFLNCSFLYAQFNLSSDELFAAARNAAFKDSNYEKAKQLAKQALLQSPEYADIEIFLGRVYTWNKQYDSAVFHFDNIHKYSPRNEEAAAAYADLEYWNEHYEKALKICNDALSANSASSQLLLRKAKILKALKQYAKASDITNELLKLNNRNTAALSLASSLKDESAVNRIGLNYDYSYFDKRYSQPWHLTSLSYSRQTSVGSVTGRINYARRFGSNGLQGEIDAYPHISRTFYSYASIGFSGSDIFPKYRAGFSLYANLPRSFEAEAGVRYLKFSSSTYIYTFYIGKYYSNFLFGFRNYLTPGNEGTSHSYSISSRYYFKGADDYLGLVIGTGISPDDRALSILYSNKVNLISRQASVSFNHSFSNLNVVSLKAGFINQKNKTSTVGNQVDFSIGYQRRF